MCDIANSFMEICTFRVQISRETRQLKVATDIRGNIAFRQVANQLQKILK